MTRKDYGRIAAVLHAERQAIKAEAPPNDLSYQAPTKQALRTVERIEQALCILFLEDNPLFDPQRFRLASGGRING